MTGLIYVVLIAMWGVVLVPRWLRHHDETRRRREAERLERALNPHATVIPDTADEEFVDWSQYLRSLTRINVAETAPWVETLRRPVGPQARRRRTIVIALAATFAISLVGVVAGLLPGVLVVLSAALLGGYVTAVALQLRQWEQRRAVAEQHQVPAQTAATYADAAPVRDGVRVMTGNRAAGSQWEPVPATLPTYTAKSKASKIPRRIDLTARGWTGADMVELARQQQTSPQLQQQFDREFAALEPDVDETVAGYANYNDDEETGYYRRAVNE